MKKSIVPFFLIVLLWTSAYSQPDTITVYDVPTQTFNTMLPVSFDTSSTFDKTSFSTGALGGAVPLSLTPPTTNLFSGSNFSDLARAELFYDVTDYPIRTAVKLYGWSNGILRHSCSGTMIGDRFVLTAAHCIYNIYTPERELLSDTVLCAPAYDNGKFQQSLPTSIAEKYYVFKSWYNMTSTREDIALLQLREPIGQQIGWIGMAFSSDTGYFSGKVFHKFSYPGRISHCDSNKIYNGDTLYYNYGNIYVPVPNALEINSPEACAIPGQSGSTFMYTDNIEYYSFGVSVYSGGYNHYQINRSGFYQFKNIMDNNPLAIWNPSADYDLVKCYPNPFSEQTTLEFNNPAHNNHSLMLYNIQGKRVQSIIGITTNSIEIKRENLVAGFYIFQLTMKGRLVSTGKLMVE